MSGIIDISKLKIPPERHELDVANYFAKLGYNIEFIPPSNIPEIHTPDILMDGVQWEIKCPQGKSQSTIENNIKKALIQSQYIIIDLKRTNLPSEYCISQAKLQFDKRTSIKRLIVIKKDRTHIIFQRK